MSLEYPKHPLHIERTLKQHEAKKLEEMFQQNRHFEDRLQFSLRQERIEWTKKEQELNNKIETLEAQRKLFKNKSSSLTEQVGKLKEETKHLEKQNVEFIKVEETLAEKQLENNSLQDQIKTLELQLREREKTIRFLKRGNFDLNGRIKDWEEEKTSFLEQLNKLESSLSAAMERTKSLEDENSTLRDKVVESKDTLARERVKTSTLIDELFASCKEMRQQKDVRVDRPKANE